jgi:hypothetical protein
MSYGKIVCAIRESSQEVDTGFGRPDRDHIPKVIAQGGNQRITTYPVQPADSC